MEAILTPRRDGRTDSGAEPESYPDDLTPEDIEQTLHDLETQLRAVETDYAQGLQECRADLENFGSKNEASEWWARVGGRALSAQMVSLSISIEQLQRAKGDG